MTSRAESPKAAGDLRLDHPPAAPPVPIDHDLAGVVRRPPRADPETARQKPASNTGSSTIFRPPHDPVATRGDRKRPVLVLQARLGDQHPPAGKGRHRPSLRSAVSSPASRSSRTRARSGPAWFCRCRFTSLTRTATHPRHRHPYEDLVPQRVIDSGIAFRRPVQRVRRPRTSSSRLRCRRGPPGQSGPHRAPPSTSARIDAAGVLPSPPVLLSGRLKREPSPSDAHPAGALPVASPVIGCDAPPRPRSSGPGRASPAPAATIWTPRAPYAGAPSRLHLQDLHRFHGLRLSSGLTSPGPRHRRGRLTTRQASLHVTDRTVARPRTGTLDAGLRPRLFPGETASLLPGSW